MITTECTKSLRADYHKAKIAARLAVMAVILSSGALLYFSWGHPTFPAAQFSVGYWIHMGGRVLGVFGMVAGLVTAFRLQIDCRK